MLHSTYNKIISYALLIFHVLEKNVNDECLYHCILTLVQKNTTWKVWYLYVRVCAFAWNLMLRPNRVASIVAQVFIDNLVCRFGLQLELRKKFRVTSVLRTLALAGYYKNQDNSPLPAISAIERIKWTMEQFHSEVVEHHQTNWGKYLALVLLP